VFVELADRRRFWPAKDKQMALDISRHRAGPSISSRSSRNPSGSAIRMKHRKREGGGEFAPQIPVSLFAPLDTNAHALDPAQHLAASAHQ